jgi:hypothetical protein
LLVKQDFVLMTASGRFGDLVTRSNLQFAALLA